MYIASTGSTAPFIVMETDMVSKGMSSNNIYEEYPLKIKERNESMKRERKVTFMSSAVSTATPAMPTSPSTIGLSEV